MQRPAGNVHPLRQTPLRFDQRMRSVLRMTCERRLGGECRANGFVDRHAYHLAPQCRRLHGTAALQTADR